MNIERLHLDKTLFYALLALAAISLFVVYSGSAKDLDATLGHLLRLVLGFTVLLFVAQIRPEILERWSPYIFVAGMLLLIAVLAIGVIGKGAQRWLNLGFFQFQPSEIMKLGVPMMLAWFLARGNLPPTLPKLALGFLIMAIPAFMIFKQPDLGTALLVFGAGTFVLFLGGMRWRVIITLLTVIAIAAPFAWGHLHDYQRQRVLTLFNPEADPLGTGYHTIQAMIAVGSGGIYGKGWLNSSQAHLDYLPESSTDFIFAVYAEEFGLLGSLLMLSIYTIIVARGLLIAYLAKDTYTRLLAGSLSLTFFLYFFVNMGMVTGILPIVGVPLPVMSYGGTSIVTIMAAFGIIMSIQTHRKITE
ncbi:cell wall shape-determining protein [Sulfuricaulis limicola]|uniref:Peptidoglycan glycosyltransferase MrdB n=1 Tax=Sulfuricaulis limicola TaxID=1620215 RepID=A0A1B4XCN7_9GAMM|nr:rod shape-determining protein RodA [Sulfuricaulis limicola]BAV32530.1 cell wall shape-determining protein [Sulfuricaulis limicola]